MVDEDLDESFGEALHAQLFELWIEPEVARRPTLVRGAVRRALVLMTSPNPEVRLNDEFEAVATVRATRAIIPGEEVTASDFDRIRSIRPAGIDPDVGWILYAVVGSDAFINFDLRSNLSRVEQMLVRAGEFLMVAEIALERGLLAPAVDNALSAAELAVKAEIYLLDTPVQESHRLRLRFWAEWVRLGNAPGHLADTFKRLTEMRGKARYADAPLPASPDEVRRALVEVGEMVAVTGGRASRSHK